MTFSLIKDMDVFEIYKILTEKNLSGDVYHMTNGPDSVVRILRDGFILTPSVGADKLSKENYFLSVSRSATNSYRLSKDGSLTSYPIFVIDKSIQNNYKVRSVDYWQMKMFKNEEEERILSDKDVISNKYIKELHMKEDLDITTMITIQEVSSKSKIPVYVYKDKKDFKFLKKEKSTLISDIEYDYEEYDYDVGRSLKKDSTLRDMEDMMNKLETRYKDQRFLGRHEYFNIRDAYHKMESTLNSAKRSRSGDVRMLVRDYFNFLKKNGYSDVKEALVDIAIKHHGYSKDTKL